MKVETHMVRPLTDSTHRLVSLVLAVALTFCTSGLWAQHQALSEKEQEKIQQGDEEYKLEYYGDAINLYKPVWEKHKSNQTLSTKLIDCYLKSRNTQSALVIFNESFVDTSNATLKNVPSYYFYNYAELLMMEEDTSKALQWYQAYLNKNSSDERALKKISALKTGLHKNKPVEQFEIRELPINTEFNEFSPTFYRNGIVFVSDRHKVEEVNPDDAYLDLYYYEKGKILIKLSSSINSELHEGPGVFYENDTKIIFTRNTTSKIEKSSEERVPIHLQLYYSEMTSSGKWKEATPLLFSSNEYSMGHPAISSDGKTIYFSSNMPGSKGETDIYTSSLQGDAWSKPVPLGVEVNTTGSEMFPFLHNDSILYFSSDGHASIGGLDIFSYNLKNSKLKNYGIPLNSSKDDFGFILDPTGSNGYFSSNRSSDSTLHDQLYGFSIFKAESRDSTKLIILDTTKHVSRDTLQPIVAGHKPLKATETSDVVESVQNFVKPTPTAELISEVYYTIQILALINPNPVKRSFLRSHEGVLWHDGKDGFHRYTIGHFETLNTALEELEKIRAEGYSDAFIRKEKNYIILSKSPGIAIEKLYATEAR